MATFKDFFRIDPNDEDTGIESILGGFAGGVGKGIPAGVIQTMRDKSADKKRKRALADQIALAGLQEIPSGRFEAERTTAEEIGTPFAGKLDTSGFQDVVKIGDKTFGKPLTAQDIAKRSADKQTQELKLKKLQREDRIFNRIFPSEGGEQPPEIPGATFTAGGLKVPLDVEHQRKQGNIKIANDLRKEFNANAQVKDFRDIRSKFGSMESALRRSNSLGEGASKVGVDQALVNLFNKITDPGSVVRESEFARTGQSLSLSSRITGALKRLSEGGAGLTDLERTELVETARVILAGGEVFFNDIQDSFQDLAEEFGVDPALVLGKDGALPKGVTRNAVRETAKKHGISEAQVIEMLRKKMGE